MAPFFGAIFVCRWCQILKSATLCDILRSSVAALNNRLRSGISHTKMAHRQRSQRRQKRASGGTMTDTVHATAPAVARVSDTYRWTQLAIGVGAMVMIANYQYGWTFFVPDIQKTF